MTSSDPSPVPADTDTQSVFTVDRIRNLVELMKEHDLSEIDLRESRQRIRLCRGPKVVAQAAAPAYAPVAAPAASAVGTSAKASEPAGDAPGTIIIKSPMVGTYYCRPNPKSEAFVKVGSQVDSSTVICIIEAMKVFNEIPAEIRGKITAILVEDGEAVEFDKPLFKLEPSK